MRLDILPSKNFEIVDTPTGNGCPLCNGFGHTFVKKEVENYGTITVMRDCICEIKRKNQERLKRSNIANAEGQRFDNYCGYEPWAAHLKAAAMKYAAENTKAWFIVCGSSGSGKTHICTAIINELINRGNECYYMKWREDSTRLKACVTKSEEYEPMIKRFKTAPVLYIDDFFKGTVTEGDKNLAFEILNERYNNRLRTIISSERDLTDIKRIDEAIAGRIFEMSKLNRFKTPPNTNYRLRA